MPTSLGHVIRIIECLIPFSLRTSSGGATVYLMIARTSLLSWIDIPR